MKNLWTHFRTWDKGRKFGCEFKDFLILLFMYAVLTVIFMLYIGGSMGIGFTFVTAFLFTGLCNRRPPE